MANIFNIKKKLNFSAGIQDLQVNFQIPKGTFITLYGKSGAGKTSILRMLAGLLKPDSGQIIINGKTWFDKQQKINLSPQQRKVGFLFQDYALFPNMTVKENLKFALAKKQNPAIIKELIELIELENLQDRKPKTLSGGQKQRVALARALVQQPKLLLLDEPLSALDYEMRAKLQTYLLQVHKTYNLTTILVSHDIPEIVKMSDIVFVLEQGRIIKKGTPIEVFKPDNLLSFKIIGKIIAIFSKKIVILTGSETVNIPVNKEVTIDFKIGDTIQLSGQLLQPVLKKTTETQILI